MLERRGTLPQHPSLTEFLDRKRNNQIDTSDAGLAAGRDRVHAILEQDRADAERWRKIRRRMSLAKPQVAAMHVQGGRPEHYYDIWIDNK